MRRILAVIAACCAALALVTVALAHAEPAVVSPGLGANLTSAPQQVAIEMTQEMARREGANDIDVFDATGKEVTTVAAAIDNSNRRKITVALPSNLRPGAYTVKWKTLSAEDGDAEDGEYLFTYDPAKPADPGRTNLKGDVPAPTVGTGDGDERPLSRLWSRRATTGCRGSLSQRLVWRD